MWKLGRLNITRSIRRYAVKSSETKYERMSPLEHVLLRPGMYVGEVYPSHTTTWIYNASNNKMEKKELYYSPAFVKVCYIDFCWGKWCNECYYRYSTRSLLMQLTIA